jgi:hypothetical protein
VRKQIGIALFAVVAVGVLIVVRVRREERSIEWHKQQYVKAGTGRTWGDQIRELWGRVIGKPYMGEGRLNRMGRHRRALIRLGYLEDRTFIVSNPSPFTGGANRPKRVRGPEYMYGDPTAQGIDRVRIIGVKEEMPQWEALVRKYDTPTWEQLMRRFDGP